jgi:hypothetical protein
MMVIISWFMIDAHKWFKGPKINIEHHMLHQNLVGVSGVEGSAYNVQTEVKKNNFE